MSGTWTCAQCGASNPADAFQCKCGALNYGGSDPGEPSFKRLKADEFVPSFDPFPHALVGKTLEVQGVASKPELNGKRGIVKDFDHSTFRYTVEITGYGSFKLKRENLRDLLMPVHAMPHQVPVPREDPLIGKTIEVQGLNARPELNGTRGVVKEFDVMGGRYTVEIEGGRGVFKLKPDNLKDPNKNTGTQENSAAAAGGLPGTYSTIPGMPGMVVKTINVNGSDKGAIIGAGGRQINKIRQESGAHCTIETPTEAETAKLTIKGSLLQVEVAEKMVQEVLSNEWSRGKWDKNAEKSGSDGWEKKPEKSWGDQSRTSYAEAPPAKKEVCKFFQNGFCGYGDQCNKEHVQAQATQKEVCKFFQNGFCGYGDQCNKAHIEVPAPQKEICKFYQNGFCGYGDQCSKAHIDTPSSQKEVQKEVCKFFQNGFCGYGDQCRMAHIESPSSEKEGSNVNGTDPNSKGQAQEGSSTSTVWKVATKKPCIYFASGNCKYGDECGFSHDSEIADKDVATPPVEKSSKPCKNFLNGNCKYGEWCGYAHEGTSSSSQRGIGAAPPAMSMPAGMPWASQSWMGAQSGHVPCGFSGGVGQGTSSMPTWGPQAGGASGVSSGGTAHGMIPSGSSWGAHAGGSSNMPVAAGTPSMPNWNAQAGMATGTSCGGAAPGGIASGNGWAAQAGCAPGASFSGAAPGGCPSSPGWGAQSGGIPGAMSSGWGAQQGDAASVSPSGPAALGIPSMPNWGAQANGLGVPSGASPNATVAGGTPSVPTWGSQAGGTLGGPSGGTAAGGNQSIHGWGSQAGAVSGEPCAGSAPGCGSSMPAWGTQTGTAYAGGDAQWNVPNSQTGVSFSGSDAQWNLPTNTTPSDTAPGGIASMPNWGAAQAGGAFDGGATVWNVQNSWAGGAYDSWSGC